MRNDNISALSQESRRIETTEKHRFMLPHDVQLIH